MILQLLLLESATASVLLDGCLVSTEVRKVDMRIYQRYFEI